MKIDKITLGEFLSYELEEINYNNKIYCFSEKNERAIIGKLKSFGLGKEHRYQGVTENNMLKTAIYKTYQMLCMIHFVICY